MSDHRGRGQHETVPWLGWRVSLRDESAENGYSSGKVATVLGSTVQSQGKKGKKETNDVCAKKKAESYSILLSSKTNSIVSEATCL